MPLLAAPRTPHTGFSAAAHAVLAVPLSAVSAARRHSLTCTAWPAARWPSAQTQRACARRVPPSSASSHGNPSESRAACGAALCARPAAWRAEPLRLPSGVHVSGSTPVPRFVLAQVHSVHRGVYLAKVPHTGVVFSMKCTPCATTLQDRSLQTALSSFTIWGTQTATRPTAQQLPEQDMAAGLSWTFLSPLRDKKLAWPCVTAALAALEGAHDRRTSWFAGVWAPHGMAEKAKEPEDPEPPDLWLSAVRCCSFESASAPGCYAAPDHHLNRRTRQSLMTPGSTRYANR